MAALSQGRHGSRQVGLDGSIGSTGYRSKLTQIGKAMAMKVSREGLIEIAAHEGRPAPKSRGLKINEVLSDPDKRASLERRFWAKVRRQGPKACWPWVAKARHRFGYGAINCGCID